MNWPNLAETNAQHAPTSGAMQAVRSAPAHTASMNSQRMRGGSAQARNSAQSSVTMALAGEEKRFMRSQRSGPPAGGGGRVATTGTAPISTSVMAVIA